MNKRRRFIEIETELKELNQRRRELLEERRTLSGVNTRNSIVQPWVNPIFSIIKNHPGINRAGILVQFDNQYMTFQDLTNCLTILRRRGWIENRGTRKFPEWYPKKDSSLSENPDSLYELPPIKEVR
jgi:hypothetical protein